MNMSCDRCGDFPGASFCPYCGERLDDGGRHGRGTDIVTAVAYISIILSMVTLVSELFGMWSGTASTFEWLVDYRSGILFLVPNLVVVGYLEGLSLQLWWLALVGAITASAILMIIGSRDVFKKESYHNGAVEGTSLFWVSVCFSGSIVITLALNAVMTSMGSGIQVPDTLPSGSSPASLFEYADAAVWEEVVSRMVYMGIPMTLAALYVKKDGWWKCLFGGFGMSRLAVVLIIISALVFAFAHMGSWGFSKVIPVFLSGILFGYLFVRFGVHACIMMHFLTDYMVVFTEVNMTVSALTMLGLMLVGLVSVLYLLRHLYRNRGFWKEIPTLIRHDGD